MPASCGFAATNRAIALIALACALFVACALAPLDQAWAYFNQATDTNPAAQDLGSFDAPIYGSQLPDGSYQVSARTTSRMCVMYLNPANAEAHDSKEQAIIIAEGGALTAVFYCSGAYTYLYPGSQEEAAAATNEDGTDPSAYIAGDPSEGDVPHLFAIPIPALNEPITYSTFNGGERGVEGGVWWTRQFVFAMSQAELASILAANSGEDEPFPEENQDVDAGDGPEALVDDGGEYPDQYNDGPTDYDDGSAEVDSVIPEAQAPLQLQEDAYVPEDAYIPEEVYEPAALTQDNVVVSGAQSGSDQGGGQASSADEGSQGDGEDQGSDSVAAKESAPAASPVKRGVRMSIVDSTITIDVNPQEAGEAPESKKPLLTPEQLFAIALAACFVVGAVARIVMFRRSYEPGEEQWSG